MKQTLYDITDDLRALEEVLTETGGDVTDEAAEQIIDEWFAEIKNDRDAKLDGYAALMRTLDARAKMRKDEADRMLALSKPDANLAKRLKARLKFYFENICSDKTVNTKRFKFSLVGAGGTQPVILDEYLRDHPEELPEGFRRVVFEPDLVKIREALERGENLEFARLGERGKSLRIK